MTLPTRLNNNQTQLPLTTLVEKYFHSIHTMYAATTLSNRNRHLHTFLKFCQQRGINDLSEVSKAVVASYQKQLFRQEHPKEKRPIANSYRAQLLHSLEKFFLWLVQNKIITDNPTIVIERPKNTKRMPRYLLTNAEMLIILNLPDLRICTGLRDRAMLETLYATAIRKDELENLKLSDICFSQPTITVSHRQRKRTIPISPRALHWLAKYIHDSRPLMNLYNRDTLFLTLIGNPLNRHSSGIITRYVRDASIGKQGSCQLFRNSVATLMLENGADIRYLQAMLGLAIGGKEIYSKLAIRKLKEVHTRTHPAKLKLVKNSEKNLDIFS